MMKLLSMLCQGKTGQGETAFELEEDISSIQKLSGLHFLNNRDLKGPQKDESHTTKAERISWHSEPGTEYLQV